MQEDHTACSRRSRQKVSRQSPLEYAPAKVSRRSRPKVTTLPHKTHRSKSARRYRQSPLEYAPAKVSRPSRPKVTTFPHRSDDPSTQNPRVQKRAPLPPEPSRVRSCQGFAALETSSNDPSTQNKSKSTRRYRQSPLECAPARALRLSGLGANSLVCISCWCAFLGARW